LKSASARPSGLAGTPLVACIALCLALVVFTACAYATACDPVISLNNFPPYTPAPPQVDATAEIPSNQRVTSWILIHNLGCGQLDWKVRDVLPGTALDCPWISESPDSGTVPPAGTSPGEGILTFTIARPPAGTQRVDFLVTSNDPLRPLVTLSWTFVVVSPTPTARTTFGQFKARFRDSQPQGR